MDSIEINELIHSINEIDEEDYLMNCDVSKEVLSLMLTWLTDAKAVSYVTGTGLQKHSNFNQTLRFIEVLATIRGDVGKIGGGIYSRVNDTMI